MGLCLALALNGWFGEVIDVKRGAVADKVFHLLIGLGFAYTFICVQDRQGVSRVPTGYFLLGVLFGASGVLIMPEQSVLTTPVPDWDLFVFGKAGHRNVLSHSFVIPALVLLTGWRIRLVRIIGIGLAVGVSSHLLGDLFQVAPGNRIIRGWYRPAAIAWMLFNSAVTFALAYVASVHIPGTVREHAVAGEGATPCDVVKQ